MEPKTERPAWEASAEKTTPSQEIPAFSPAEAARLWGIWSDGRSFNGQRRRYDYSLM